MLIHNALGSGLDPVVFLRGSDLDTLSIPDPTQITDFDQSDEQLEITLLFWVLVAGKTAHVVVRQMESLLPCLYTGACQEPGGSVFAALRAHDLPSIQRKLKEAGIGCWGLKGTACYELAHVGLDLRTCSPDDLQRIKGIGPKTARCFILHSRRDAEVAGLDTHILRYLRELGYKGVPASTPGSVRLYAEWEQIVLNEAKHHGLAPAEFDLWVWNQYARRAKESQRVAQNA